MVLLGVKTYYNEFDPKAAAWLRELIADGLIAPGVVDTRSITDVKPDELAGFTRCHFFAGIGGWDYALQLAGWPADAPVWTGSCPCQPFSVAGKGDGASDPRHLWPAWFKLIEACRPPVVFGEQVEAAIRHGWLDLVADDLERAGYAWRASVLPAAGVGAFHNRSRLWFVASAVANDDSRGREVSGLEDARAAQDGPHGGDSSARRDVADGRGAAGRVGEPDGAREGGVQEGPRAEPTGGWAGTPVIWIECRDGKYRAVPATRDWEAEPTLFPLADGIPGRVGLLRGAGNAIVPQVAAAWVEEFLTAASPEGEVAA